MRAPRDAMRTAAMWSFAAALVLATGLSMSPAVAETDRFLEGQWLVEGQDPDGSVYGGFATLTAGAHSLSFHGEIDGDTYTGAGLWNEETRALAVDFVERSSGATGLSLFVYDDGMLKGHWVYSHAPQEVGMETWRRPNS